MQTRLTSLAALAVICTFLASTAPAGADEPTAEKPAAPAAAEQPAAQPAAEKAAPAKADPHAWRSLFDGKSLKNWKATSYGGEGEVEVKEGKIILELGEPMTGITWTGGDLPKTNYELELEGRRADGHDFFATTTFPIGDEFASFVVGGWAGTVVGISCVDFYDASDNMTTTFKDFKDNTWYKVRVRVTDAKLECWIDNEQTVDQPRKDHRFSLRLEVEENKPLGVSTYMTTGEIRNIRLRMLRPEEVAAAREDAEAQE